MQLSLTWVKRLAYRNGLCCCCHPLAAIAASAGSSAIRSGDRCLKPFRKFAPEHDPLVDAAFDHFYNMDYDRAIQEFEKIVERRPDDPSSVNHLLSAVLMRELYRMGAMNSGEYANDSFVGEAHRSCRPK